MQLIVLFKKNTTVILTMPVDVSSIICKDNMQISAELKENSVEIGFNATSISATEETSINLTQIDTGLEYVDRTESFTPIEILNKYNDNNNKEAILRMINRFCEMKSENIIVDDYKVDDGDTSGVVITFK
jgi:hypothetical protein